MMQYTAQRIWDHHGQNHSAVLPQGQRISPGRGTRTAGRPDERGGSTADPHRERAPRPRPDNAAPVTRVDTASPDGNSHNPYAPALQADHVHAPDRYVGFGLHADD
ncbi:hypothetical protein AB0N62_23380 [Streptomyces sp. NPDC093982]|uniref:hypothetical protein n=1 Tax=Streptomyces sp. NPDC093982 TaxID=3155077 RepID=UPI0034148E1A